MKRNKTRKHKYLLFLLSFAMLIGVFPMTAFAQEGEVSHLTLLTAAPIYCQSELVPLPKTGTAERSLMVFTKENEAISSYNCPQMKYSIYNGRTWTLPLTIKEDETWDMDQFLYSDEEVLVAWTEGTESFDKEETGNELASKMRISLTALDPATSKFKPVISNVSSYDTENTSTYNPRISKVGDKLLVSWVVCHNVSNDASSYGVEGLYYNPETNTFYGENNEEDASGNPVPMVFAKGCNYISTHDITKVGDQMVTLFEEENNQSHISEVLFEKIVAQADTFPLNKRKENRINLATNQGNTLTALTDGASYGAIVEADISTLYYYNKDKLYSIGEGLTSVEAGDVSKTGDTSYKIVSKNGVPAYVTAVQYEPLNIEDREIVIEGKTYTRTEDDQWIDEKGKIKEIEQEDIAFYYINHETKKLDILAEKLYNQDGLFFSSTLSSYINEEDQFVCSYVKGKMGDRTTSILNKILATSKCDEAYLSRANYTEVEAAISKIPEDLSIYTEESVQALIEAKEAVATGKPIMEQEAVTAMAKRIEAAIRALEKKPVIPPITAPKIIEGANQTIEQGKTVTIKSDGRIEDFQQLLVDGKEVAPNHYTLSSGSTVITLNAEFLKTLSLGKHTLGMVFTNGTAETDFTIIQAPISDKPTNGTTADNTDTTKPQTGDNHKMLLIEVLLLASVGGMLALILTRKSIAK